MKIKKRKKSRSPTQSQFQVTNPTKLSNTSQPSNTTVALKAPQEKSHGKSNATHHGVQLGKPGKTGSIGLSSLPPHVVEKLYDNLDEIYDIILVMHIFLVIHFLIFTFIRNTCDTEFSSIGDIDNLAAFVSTHLGISSIVFSETISNTKPYNYLCIWLYILGIAYVTANATCNRDLLLICETIGVTIMAHYMAFLITYYIRYDFTPLTPILTYTYLVGVISTVLCMAYINNSVPLAMLSIVNISIVFALEVCVTQFTFTQNPFYSLPEGGIITGAILLFSLHVNFNQHAILLAFYLFNGHNN